MAGSNVMSCVVFLLLEGLNCFLPGSRVVLPLLMKLSCLNRVHNYMFELCFGRMAANVSFGFQVHRKMEIKSTLILDHELVSNC